MIRSHHPITPRIQFLALTALLGLSLTGLTRCRRVPERVTGIDLRGPQTFGLRGGCARACNTDFSAAVIAEEKRFLAERRACGHSALCHHDADRDHARYLTELLRARQKCKRGCYNEGGGKNGG